MLLSICFHSKWRLSMVDYCRTEDIAISTALDAPQDGLPNFGEARWPTWRRRWIWDLSKVFGQSLGLSTTKTKMEYCRDIWWRLSPPKRPQKAYVPLIFGSQRIFWGDFFVPVPDLYWKGLCSDLGPIDLPVLCSNSYLDPQAATKDVGRRTGREVCKGLQGNSME